MKAMRFKENPFLSAEMNAVNQDESSEDEEHAAKREQRTLMEEDGFTLVAVEGEPTNKNRVKVRDRMGATTVIGIDPEEA